MARSTLSDLHGPKTEFQKSATHLQYHAVGTSDPWQNVIPLAELQGVPGANAVPTSDAIAALVTNPIASAAQKAIDSRYGFAYEAYFDATGKANGALAAMDSGQPIYNFGDVIFNISGGKIVQPVLNEAGVGAYAEVDLRGKLGHIGATFEFTSAQRGTVVLISPSAAWRNGVVAAGVHFGIWPTGWAFTYYNQATGGEVVVAEGTHNLPLNTPLDVDIYVEGALATIVLPDGKIKYAENQNIANLSGAYAVWETFEVDGATMPPPRIIKMRADSAPAYSVPARDNVKKMSESVALARSFATTLVWDIPTTEAAIGVSYFATEFVWPVSRKVIVTLNVNIELVGTDNILVRPVTGTRVAPRQGIQQSAYAGSVGSSWLLEGGVAGKREVLDWQALRTGGATSAKLRVGGNYGVATVTIAPVVGPDTFL